MVEYPSLIVVRYISILLLVIGTCGNILSLIVLSRPNIRKIKIGAYLIILCVSDIAVLFFGLFEVILRTYRIYVIHRNLSMCRVWLFFMMFPSDCSSWLTVIITLERAVSVYFPLETYSVSIPGCTLLTVIIPGVILAGLNGADVFFWSYKDNRCHPQNHFQTLFHGALYSYMPALIIIVCNLGIAYKLCRRPTLGRSQPTRYGPVKMILSINVVFLITTIPFSVVLFYENYDIEETGPGSNMLYANLVSCVNNAINFILYFATAEIFRKELKLLFRIKPKSVTILNSELAITAI